MSDATPVRGFTAVDLGKLAEMIGRSVGRTLDEVGEPTFKANVSDGRCLAQVVVRMRGRPPLLITVEEGE